MTKETLIAKKIKPMAAPPRTKKRAVGFPLSCNDTGSQKDDHKNTPDQ